jgi:hypothetical protein
MRYKGRDSASGIDRKLRPCSPADLQGLSRAFCSHEASRRLLTCRNPIVPECTVHSNDQNLRLIMRITWKIDGGFLPMSFILDTGAMSDNFISKEGRAAV